MLFCFPRGTKNKNVRSKIAVITIAPKPENNDMVFAFFILSALAFAASSFFLASLDS